MKALDFVTFRIFILLVGINSGMNEELNSGMNEELNSGMDGELNSEAAEEIILRKMISVGMESACDNETIDNFVRNYKTRLNFKLIELREDSVTIKNKYTQSIYNLSISEYVAVFDLIYFDFKKNSYLKTKYFELPVESKMKLGSAALLLIKNRVLSNTFLNRLVENATELLRWGIKSSELMRIKKEGNDNIPLRVLLSLIIRKMATRYVLLIKNHKSIIPDFDPTNLENRQKHFDVLNPGLFKTPEGALIFFFCVRILGIVELSIRPCIIYQQICDDVATAIGACRLTSIVPPIDTESCRSIYLLEDENHTEIQNRVWPDLVRVCGFVGTGISILYENCLSEMIRMHEKTFLRKLSIPKLEKKDLEDLKLFVMSDMEQISEYLYWLQEATKLKMFALITHNKAKRRYRFIKRVINRVFTANLKRNELFEFLSRQQNLKILAIENVNLFEIKKGALRNLKSLELLSLSMNGLSEVPSEIKYLKKLKYLDLSFNSLKKLGDDITQCSSLNTIILDGNRLKSLSKNMHMLENLERVHINENGCDNTILEDLCGCSNLSTLFAAENRFTALPDNFYKLKNLLTLYIERNEFVAFPMVLYRIPSLIDVSLCNNKITYIPAGISKLNDLHRFNVRGNEITGLPKEIVEMKKRNKNFQMIVSSMFLNQFPTDGEIGEEMYMDLFGYLGTEYAVYDDVYNIEHTKWLLYRDLNKETIRWNFPKIAQMRVSEPPIHKMKLISEVLGLFEKLVSESGLQNEVNFDRIKRYIIKHYEGPNIGSAVKSYKRGGVDEDMQSSKDYFEAILLSVENMLSSTEIDRIETAKVIMKRLGEVFNFCSTAVTVEMPLIYRECCGGGCTKRDGDSSFYDYIMTSLGELKNYTFHSLITGMSYSETNSVHTVMHWMRYFKDELGFSGTFSDVYGILNAYDVSTDPINILMMFYDNFTVFNAVYWLKDKINEGNVGPAVKYLVSNGLLNSGNVRKCMEFDENSDLETVLEYSEYSGLKALGVIEILKHMEIIYMY